MGPNFPYTYIQCPCEIENPLTRRTTHDGDIRRGGDADEERTFDPRSPLANFSLYPIEYLHYCQDCHQIRCPRCVLDEIVTWYCPNCLFEVPSSTVKSEGNRCTRSCFQCPICVAPLSVTSLETPGSSKLLSVEPALQGGPWVLSCPCCSWSSTEIGIKFDKPNGIYTQLSKIRNGGEIIKPVSTRHMRRRSTITDDPILDISSPIEEEDEDEVGEENNSGVLDAETQFATLRSFYSSQMADTSSGSKFPFANDLGYGSPSSLSRIMSLYTGSSYGGRKIKAKTQGMREAHGPNEGLQVFTGDEETVSKLAEEGWDGTASNFQRSLQARNTRFLSDLRPVPYLLRTKRSKRCRTCRHILSKPEAKVQTTRYRIRLVALEYIPGMSIKPLPAPSFGSSTSSTQHPVPTPAPAVPSYILKPLKTAQFLLTMKNPLFEPIKVTLATPSHTPGRFASKTTILCPEFEIGASTDAWDEALNAGPTSSSDHRRSLKELNTSQLDSSQIQAEAGKVWERGRNWVSVVIEVVPASLTSEIKFSADDGDPDATEEEEILEIPVFVRIEWETDLGQDDALGKERDVERESGAKNGREKKELAYWTVLGIGRIES